MALRLVPVLIFYLLSPLAHAQVGKTCTVLICPKAGYKECPCDDYACCEGLPPGTQKPQAAPAADEWYGRGLPIGQQLLINGAVQLNKAAAQAMGDAIRNSLNQPEDPNEIRRRQARAREREIFAHELEQRKAEDERIKQAALDSEMHKELGLLKKGGSEMSDADLLKLSKKKKIGGGLFAQGSAFEQLCAMNKGATPAVAGFDKNGARGSLPFGFVVPDKNELDGLGAPPAVDPSAVGPFCDKLQMPDAPGKAVWSRGTLASEKPKTAVAEEKTDGKPDWRKHLVAPEWMKEVPAPPAAVFAAQIVRQSQYDVDKAKVQAQEVDHRLAEAQKTKEDIEAQKHAVQNHPQEKPEEPKKKEHSILAELEREEKKVDKVVTTLEKEKVTADKQVKQAEARHEQVKAEAKAAMTDESKKQEFVAKHADTWEKAKLVSAAQANGPGVSPNGSAKPSQNSVPALGAWSAGASAAKEVHAGAAPEPEPAAAAGGPGPSAVREDILPALIIPLQASDCTPPAQLKGSPQPPDRRQWCERTDKDGKTIAHGKAVIWYPNGRKQAEGQFENGKQTGLWTYYHETGFASEAGSFVGGERSGKWEVYSLDGALDGRIEYNGTKEAKAVRFFEGTRRKKEEGSLIEGKREGIWTLYSENGGVLLRRMYKDNQEVATVL